MNFRNLFGGKKQDPANDPDMIRLFDSYGREVYLPRAEWKKTVLANLKQARNNPDQLYDMLVSAVQDGFADDVVADAEHLHRTDPVPSRGATILGIVYMKSKRLDEARRVLEDFLKRHGEDGVVLTNLAKVYGYRGDEALAESTLWHALEVDPNQDNGLNWYAAIQRERKGEAAMVQAFERVARLPKSWRAQLWLAREALEKKDLTAAVKLYTEALERAERPIPPDLLMQMSGDLGNNGHLDEIVRLVEPHFDPAFHGLQVGNNLIKANLELGRLGSARRVMNQLYALKRPDWQEILHHWDTELAGADLKAQKEPPAGPLAVSLISIEAPLWARDGSALSALIPDKGAGAHAVAVFGSTAMLAGASDKPTLQLSNDPGRLSRALPLVLAEKVQLATDAVGCAMIPWIENRGFGLFGRPYEDRELCDLAGKDERRFDTVAGITIDARRAPWKILLRVLRKSDAQCMAETEVEASPDNPAPAVVDLSENLLKLLARHAGVRSTPWPAWYRLPPGADFSDYLLRLEQQLAVVFMNLQDIQGAGLFGEREIMDGILKLCVRCPDNPLLRMLLVQTLRQMHRARPEVVREYGEKIALLQRDHPLSGAAALLISKIISEVF